VINRLLNKHKKKKAAGDRGFTLIELLVVITILGILTAIVILSLTGLGDKGKAAATSEDASTLRTAEEAYCTATGSYGTMTQLRGTASTGSSYIATIPKYNGVVPYTLTTTTNGCGGTGSLYAVGPVSYSGTSGPMILSASNNTGADSFMTGDFAATNQPVQFTFSASSTLLTTGTTAGNTASLYLPADELHALATIPNGATAGSTTATGTCGTVTTGNPETASCPGEASTFVQYAQGRLVAFACSPTGVTIQPATSGALAQCSAPSSNLGGGGDFLPPGDAATAPSTAAGTAAPTTPAQIVAMLQACTTCVLAIADPQTTAGTNKSTTTGDGGPSGGKYNGGGSGVVLDTTTGLPAAPYGYAAYQALTASGTGGGALTTTGLTANACPTSGSVNTDFWGLVCTGQIIFGSSVTTTQALVESGNANMALLPRSFVMSPVANDTNYWQTSDTTANAALYNPILQYGVLLQYGRNPNDVTVAQSFLNFILSTEGHAILQAFGYV
jgi:prepilin-type N-terminal cleavage/methylation domain-containing protein